MTPVAARNITQPLGSPCSTSDQDRGRMTENKIHGGGA